MWGVPLAIVVGNGLEWLIHKHILHGLGKKRTSYWSFHWHEHHGVARRTGGHDPAYDAPWYRSRANAREVLALVGAGAAFLPLLPFTPSFVLTLWGWGVLYYTVHAKSHRDPAWGRRWVPWHMDHHLARDQDANWGVVLPLWDHLLGTRVVYLGTETERADTARRLARLAKLGAAPA